MSTIIQVTSEDLDKAIEEIKHAVKWEAAVYMDIGYNFYHTEAENMPVNYTELVDFVGNSKLIPVLQVYSSDKILQDVNDKFDFWNTILHLKHRYKYSLKGNLAVSKCMLDQAETIGVSSLAYKVLEALTVGKTKYYFAHEVEVVREDKFVELCISNGIKFAITHRQDKQER